MLLETIRIIHQQPQNLSHHQARFDHSRKTLFNVKDNINLASYIPIPKDQGCYKCRILYQKDIQKIELVPYQIRPIKSLQLVIADDIIYNFKYANRQHLNALAAQKGQADDVLIIKNGYITDTSYSNTVFWDGKMWWTPDTPLLCGTRRAKYLQEGRIKERAIQVNDLENYQGAKVINAMVGLDDAETIDIHQIKKASHFLM